MAAWTGLTSQRRRLAARWIIELLAAVFVDAMRMFYVGAGALARHANETRYDKFRQMGEHHLLDLDRQLIRFATDLDPELLFRIRNLEPRLRWVVNELAPAPCGSKEAPRYLRHMAQTAESLSSLCDDAGIEHYAEARTMIDEIAGGLWPDAEASSQALDLDRLFNVRLKAQSEFLERTQQGKRWPLLTIADDLNQAVALAYFLIDRWLLERSVP